MVDIYCLSVTSTSKCIDTKVYVILWEKIKMQKYRAENRIQTQSMVSIS